MSRTALAITPAAPAPAHPFEALFNSPEFRARRAERERQDAATRAEALAEHGTAEAVFADTPMEAALRAACEPLLGPGETWDGLHKLAGWDWLDGLRAMPGTLRTVVETAWPLPATVVEAWAEHQERGRLDSQRHAFDPDWSASTPAAARRDVVEGLLDTLPARSLADMRARLSWLDELNDIEARGEDRQRGRLATLRADVERMAMRLRAQGSEQPR